MRTQTLRIRLDEQGHVVLPPELVERFGLVQGATVRVDEAGDEIAIGRSTASLARIYVEPTTLCNLQCRTCIRNDWDATPGMMSAATFGRIIDGARAVSPLPTIFLGGFGEPFAHPDLLAMLAAAKSIGSRVELITNGTRLDEETRRALVRIGLDRLWVSIDGATPESYADIRLWDALPEVTADLARLRELRIVTGSALPRLGIAFVAMKRNIADLPAVLRLGRRLGADRFSVSNVLPHTAEMRDQVLYARSIEAEDVEPSPWAPEVALARMDIDEPVIEALARVEAGRHGGARFWAWPRAGGRTAARSWRRGACRCAGTARSAPACRSSTAIAATSTSGPARATPSPWATSTSGACSRPGATPPTSPCASGCWPSTSLPAPPATAATWPTRTSRTASAARPRPAAAASGRRGSSAARSRGV